MSSRTTIITCLTLLLVFLSIGANAEAADKENCLMCHKYRFLARVNENGKTVNYNVDQRIYMDTVHKKVSCRECHTYIKKVPHDPVNKQVDCGNLCHIKTPFSKERFSHERIIKIYQRSVHAPKPEDTPKQKKAKPGCKFCHLNPMYTQVSQQGTVIKTSLARCLNCHQKQGVTQAYKHMTHRLRRKTSRSPQEIVQLCAKCHTDTELMKRFEVSEKALTAVETYKRSIHGKSVILGSDEAADCISCHASNKLHDVYSDKNRASTVHQKNISKTCKQCHEQTNSWFVKVAVHPTTEREENPIIYFMSLSLRFAMYGTVFGLVGLMLIETYARKRKGVSFLLRDGTSWRGRPRQKDNT